VRQLFHRAPVPADEVPALVDQLLPEVAPVRERVNP